MIASHRASPVRGVFFAPWLGPNGETVLFAVRRNGTLLDQPTEIPARQNPAIALDELWERLDRDDPVPGLRVI